MAGDFGAKLDLSTLVNGDLNEEFIKHYQDVLKSLKRGEKGKVTMNVSILRIEDMDTIVGIEYDIKSTKPTRKKSSVAAITEVNGQLALMTDKPKEPLQNVSMFNKTINE